MAPAWTDHDTWLHREGTHEALYRLLGAHHDLVDGEDVTTFRVWSPATTEVWLEGAPPGGRAAVPLPRVGASDIFEATVPGIGPGAPYFYRLQADDGTWHSKADPFAHHAQLAPGWHSKVASCAFRWRDAAWRRHRARTNPWTAPISTYELHLGSWARTRDLDPTQPVYRAVADPLIAHIERLGFTHVELMPVMEHPYYPSWGYQITGYFAPTSRYGGPTDLMYLIDRLHRRGIGVILDWVPAHFPTDPHGLYRWNGRPVYEHPDPKRGWHPDWTTAIPDYGRGEVRSFLLSNAMYWFDRFHVDGLRVDAVASMLYLDYSRSEGGWTPNIHGGNHNLEAISLLRRINQQVRARWPHALMIAEESTSFPGVSRPVDEGGLGFAFKWDMGWMNDTLRHLAREPIHRQHHHDELSFRAVYQHTENFVLPLSHDEVVHGKGSLASRMPGDDDQRRANVRLLFGLQYGQPGKKLLFMGSEVAPWQEWSCDDGVDLALADRAGHAGITRLVAELNRLYREQRALHALDVHTDGFAWIAAYDARAGVLAWERRAPDTPPVVVVAHTTPVARPGYRIGLPCGGTWRVLLDTDRPWFGGLGAAHNPPRPAEPTPWDDRRWSLPVDLPPLGVLFLTPSEG